MVLMVLDAWVTTVFSVQNCALSHCFQTCSHISWTRSSTSSPESVQLALWAMDRNLWSNVWKKLSRSHGMASWSAMGPSLSVAADDPIAIRLPILYVEHQRPRF